MGRRRRVAVSAAAVVAAVAILAATGVSAEERTLWLDGNDDYGVALQGGNDLIGDYGDKFLTGSGFGVLSIPDREERLLAWTGSPGVFFGGFGFRFYTPLEKEPSNPPQGDRPYALYGYLTGGFATAHEIGERITQDRAELELGATGPFLGGDEIQNGLHDLIGADPVNGWDTQVGTETYLAVSGERAWRLFSPFSGREAEIAPFIGATLGTSETSATFGVDVAFGDRLGEDVFWRERATGARAAIAGAPRDHLSWRFSAGADLKVVGYDATLDGGFFNDGRDVDMVPVRWRVRVGAAATWRSLTFGYDLALLGPEFVGQNQPQAVGALTLSTSF